MLYFCSKAVIVVCTPVHTLFLGHFNNMLEDRKRFILIYTRGHVCMGMSHNNKDGVDKVSLEIVIEGFFVD